MFDQNILPQLKGAPLSIIFLLMMTGNRTISVSDLSVQTGFDRKTTRKGLDILMEHQIITSPRTNRYQLVGKNVQLPLYWDEKIEPLPEAEKEWGKIPQCGNIPQDSNAATSDEDVEKFPNEEKIPQEWGNIPQEVNLININNPNTKEVSKYVDTDTYLLNGNTNNTKLTAEENFPNEEKIPELFLTAWTVTLQQMEANMSKGTYMDILHGAVPIGYEDGHYTILMDNPFKRDWAETRLTGTIEKILTGILSKEISVSFVMDNQSAAGDSPLRHNAVSTGTVPELPYEAPSLELLPEPEDPKQKELTEICNDYLLDPVGIEYSKDELKGLIAPTETGRYVHPEVLQYLLPNAGNYAEARKMSRWDIKYLKQKLLTAPGIIGEARVRITNNDKISAEDIRNVLDELFSEDDPKFVRGNKLTEDGKKVAIYRIEQRGI